MRLKVIGSGGWAQVYRSLLPVPEHTDASLPDAAIIVSKSHQHHPDTLQYLRWGVPCLVEKPFAMSVPQCEDMIATAESKGVYLAAAHVLKFDRRIEPLRPSVGSYVRITWTDPCNGRYDPSVPIEVDVLPHIVSIVDTLKPGDDIVCDGVSFAGRGRDIRLVAGRTTFDVHLERDAWKRQRIIDCGETALDFSALPEDHNPLRDLIEAFAAACGQFIPPRMIGLDWRLETQLALKSCCVTEDVLTCVERYRPNVEEYAGP
jgi:hypothetical protein